ncbi:MAG TPA: ABC transporter ATP-binding protein, partial [Chitinophagaceae bacterium]|nr:ABC transporter ATP-binding protein [Chitinophagaceae bacterium]
MNTIIRVKNLSKRFGELQAVDQLSFSVSAGEVYGFLGQNGAGKSTTIRMLLTLIEPDEGEIEIFGLNLRQHRKEILKRTGAVIERPDLYKYLSALDNLSIFARLSGMKASRKQLMDQLAMVGLAERADSRVKTYSQGMKQRLGLACALVHDPGLIILDEPTNGLDPQGIAEMREMIIRLSREGGKTLLVSSHLLSEMEMMASSLLIIDNGRKVAEGKLDELLNPKTALVELLVTDTAAARQLLEQTDWIQNIHEKTDQRLRFEMEKARIAELTRFLVSKGLDIQSIRPVHSLEEYFLAQT